jgi:hypothetical protein
MKPILTKNVKKLKMKKLIKSSFNLKFKNALNVKSISRKLMAVIICNVKNVYSIFVGFVWRNMNQIIFQHPNVIRWQMLTGSKFLNLDNNDKILNKNVAKKFSSKS